MRLSGTRIEVADGLESTNDESRADRPGEIYEQSVELARFNSLVVADRRLDERHALLERGIVAASRRSWLPPPQCDRQMQGCGESGLRDLA